MLMFIIEIEFTYEIVNYLIVILINLMGYTYVNVITVINLNIGIR